MLLTGVLLLAAICLIVAALSTGHFTLAWGSVALSAAVAVMIVVRWRRRWDSPEVESAELLDEEPVAAAHGAQLTDPAPVNPVIVSMGGAKDTELTDAEVAEPGEEDTDAADLLVVYELTDEVLVVDGHPRYHLTRCPRPDRVRSEQLPVREARELGFTPCARCRPDKTLVRRHRASNATMGGG